MLPALRQLLTEAPPLCGASVMVDRYVFENGSAEEVTAIVRRDLARVLADFIAGSVLLDGADETGFRIAPVYDMDATRFDATVHVLTPRQLKEMLQKAFQLGQKSVEPIRINVESYPFKLRS
jgi:hypothetical protein